MQLIEFALKGVGLAVVAALFGVLVVAAVEVIRAYNDPGRRDLISHRSWRENLRHMLQ